MNTDKRVGSLPVWARSLITANQRTIESQRSLVESAGWLLTSDRGGWSVAKDNPYSASAGNVYLPLPKYSRIVGPRGVGHLILREDMMEFYADDRAVIYPLATNCLAIGCGERGMGCGGDKHGS